VLLLVRLSRCRAYADPFDGSTQQGPELTLIPEVGSPATVDILNVYAGKVGHRREA
jgi:hypothetical protein